MGIITIGRISVKNPKSVSRIHDEILKQNIQLCSSYTGTQCNCIATALFKIANRTTRIVKINWLVIYISKKHIGTARAHDNAPLTHSLLPRDKQ